MKRTILIILSLILMITACSTNDGPASTEVMRQWAYKAKASDAFGGVLGKSVDDQTPYSATGAPDAELCKDSQRSWVISKENDGLHWLELEYYTPVYVTNVNVLETMNPGSIKKIELKKDGEWFMFWNSTYSTKECSQWLKATYSQTIDNKTYDYTNFKTDFVKITIDTNHVGWNEIDAVELVGYANELENINGTLRFV